MNPQSSQHISDAVSNGGETMEKAYDTHFLLTGLGGQDCWKQ